MDSCRILNMGTNVYTESGVLLSGKKKCGRKYKIPIETLKIIALVKHVIGTMAKAFFVYMFKYYMTFLQALLK